MKPRSIAASAVALCAAVACSNHPTSPPYNVTLPTAWASAVTNQYFPLVPGTTYEYRGQTSGGLETTIVEVLSDTRMVNGVRAAVVRDRVLVNGQLVEETLDWYAQDVAGNVWYLGEDSKEIENGRVVSTEGSWEWGVRGALPGIIMWADPAAHIGEEYRQEYFKGEAEDWGKVLSVDQTVTVPHGTFTRCVKTEDWNALERGTRENKYYCPTLGFTLEVTGSERLELIRVSRN